MAAITAVGIGNILLSDEGFGVRVIEELQQNYLLSDQVQVLDGGTLGLDLIRYIAGSEKLIIIDAICGKEPPGHLYHLHGDEVQAYFREKVSMHEMGIMDVLRIVDQIGLPVNEVVVIGCEPESLEMGLTLSPVVEDCLQPAIQAVLRQLTLWEAQSQKLEEG